MKKIFAILLVGVLMLLPSCGKKVKKETVTPQRPDCKVTVKYNDIDYSANVRYSDIGVMTVSLLAPLDGMTISVGDNGCELMYDGMKLEYGEQEMNRFCPFLELYGLLKTVCYTVPESVTASGDKYVLKYRTPEVSCKAISNKQDGKLREIEADKLKFIFQ